MNFRTTLFISTLFVLFVGVYFLFLQDGSDDGPPKPQQKKIREVYKLGKDKVRRIRVSFKDPSYASFTLAKRIDDSWELTEPVLADADGNRVDEMLGDLLNKRIKRTMDVTELTQYGLDKPNIRIELSTEEKSPNTCFLIGKKTINYSVYAKEQSDSHIFLIESSALRDFTKSPTDVRTRTVLKFNPSQVSSISLRVGSRTEIRCQSDGADAWQMLQPVRAKADAKEIRLILDALALLKVVVFEEDGPINLAAYGLDEPRIQVVIQLPNGSQQLLVGSDDAEAERIYIKHGAVDAVYAVNEEIYGVLDKVIFDLREKRVIDFERTTTNRFEIKRGTEKIVCSKRINDEWQIEEPVALKANPAVVHDFLFGVDSLEAVEFVSDQPESLGPYGLAHPSIQVFFSSPDSGLSVLLIGDQEGDNVYVKNRDSSSIVLVRNDLLDFVGLGVEGLRDK